MGAVLLGAASPALAQCPESTIGLPFSAPVQTLTSTFEGADNGGWIKGDHRVGQYSLHHEGSLSPTVVVARDRYEVMGVALGSPVNVTLRFHIDGWTYTGGCGGTGCCGLLLATARAGPDTAQVLLSGQTFGGRMDFSGVVELPVTLVAGTPRDLEVEMWARRCAGGSHTVDATGLVVFEGTDPSASVISCKGFGPRAVPVLRRSWGELKSIYR